MGIFSYLPAAAGVGQGFPACRRGCSMARIGLENCNCFAVRKAARRVTQAYDTALAPSGIRATQFMLLMALNRSEGVSVNELAELMGMDRTTMGKNLRPLERDGLVEGRVAKADR